MSTKALDQKSLAYWRKHVDEFIEQCLINPETGRPFVLLEAEREFLKHAFATGPDGRLLYPTLIYAAIKKSGKTTFAGIVVPTLLLLFGGRYAEGYCIANDLEQSKARVFEAIKRIVQASPLLANEADITPTKSPLLLPARPSPPFPAITPHPLALIPPSACLTSCGVSPARRLGGCGMSSSPHRRARFPVVWWSPMPASAVRANCSRTSVSVA
jgi:hypothetical protein